MKRVLIPLLMVLLCLSVCAAGSAANNVFRFEKTPGFVFIGESVPLSLTAEGDPAAAEVTYASKSPSIATVNDQGVVTGVSKGQAVITAVCQAGGRTLTAQTRITVGLKAESVELNAQRLPLYAPDDPVVSSLLAAPKDGEAPMNVLLLPVRKSLTLAANVLPTNATSRKVTLSASDAAVLQVRQNIVTGLAPGETVLTVANDLSPEVALQVRVLVVQPVTKLTVQAGDAAVAVGEQMALTAVAQPENATLKGVTWSSGSEKIATVDENGVVTGVSRGTGRIIATAVDGSGVRANYTVRVVQRPTGIQLNTDSVTVDVGRTAIVKATVLPASADNKGILWSSSDERVATVGRDGRITAVALGECTVTAACSGAESLTAALKVIVQQPVTRLTFNGRDVFAYAGETSQLSWTVEPANASNPTLSFTSSNPRVLTVDQNGQITGVSGGNAYVQAATTDGSNRKARILVRVGRHVTGVEMVRKNAYLDLHESLTAGATIYPRDATNKNMTWSSSDPSVVTATGNTNSRMRLTSTGYGDATVTGITEDGGFETSIQVHVGDYNRHVRLLNYTAFEDKTFWLSIRNDTDLVLTNLTVELEMYDQTGGAMDPVLINYRDGSNKVQIVWSGRLYPGETTGRSRWQMIHYQAPSLRLSRIWKRFTLVSYQIDNDWIKTIPTSRRQTID